MASRGRSTIRYREPHPNMSVFSSPVGMKMYVWGGVERAKEDLSKVDVFDPIRESWKQLESKGDFPVGVQGGGSASVLNDIYTYGGADKGGNEYDGLHKLDTATMRWSYVNPRSRVRPSAKGSTRMVAISDNRLAMFGGYLPKVVKKNKNPFQKNTTTGGICAEFHIFDIEKAEWSIPTVHGDTPQARSNYSFTSVDDKRAVMFGGLSKNARSDEVHIIHWDGMLWTKIPKTGPWPKGRKAHSACCLNYGQPNPKVLMCGGQDLEREILKDLWILDVNQCRWKQLPNLPRPARKGHVITAFPLSEEVVEVSMFGGENADKKFSHTTILHFENDGEDNWELTNIIEPADVGRPIERVQEKMESLGISTQTADTRPQAQPQPQTQTNGEGQKCKESSQDGEDSLGHLSARPKRNYIISLDELTFGKQLGEGAYGTVYAGTWKTQGGVEVAIKKCFNKPFDAEILSVLPRHPNVVLFYATSSSEDATYIVTELVTNGSLQDYIHSGKQELEYQQAISWAKQVAFGMEHLHGHHIVHRDLKSGNVLISEDMTLKVCDFGTARAVVDKCEQSTVRGTYRWMAPEIMREDDAVIDKMCDVFSYGCVLYELFEKKLPYHKEKNSVFLAMKVLDGLRPEITDSSIPQFLTDLMKACWEEDPQSRPQFEDIITSLRMKSFKR